MVVEDIRHVVDYLATLPCVDEDRMGILGICGGGSCVIDATMTKRRIKAVASMPASTASSVARLSWFRSHRHRADAGPLS